MNAVVSKFSLLSSVTTTRENSLMEVLKTISMSLPFLLYLPLILLPLFFLTCKFKHLKRPNFPPSPPKLPIIGNMHQLGNSPHRSLRKLSQKYGPVMLLQLGRVPTLVVSSAETAKEVLKTHDLEFCSRPPLVGPKRLSYNFLDVAFGPYSECWREIRKICVLELLSAKRVQSSRFIREEEVASMIDSIFRSAANTPIDLSQKLISLTAQIVCRVAFGKNVQHGEFDNSRFQEILYEAMAMLGSFAASDLFPKVGWIIDILTGLNGRLEKSFHDFDVFYQGVIDEHLDPERPKLEHEDIIDVLLKLGKDESGAIRLTNDHIKATLMDIFLAAVDTSAVTMNWAMTELVRNPEAMKKVQEEIRSCMGKKGKVEEADLDQFQYLKMVVKETLRLHPPGPLLIPRESMQHSKINGYDIQPKTRVLINVWAIGRNPEYWEKPDEFFPERFTDSSIDFKGQNFEFLPFGGGRRGCPGINMGVTMVELALANLLYHFDWELPKGMKKEDINMDESSGLTVHKKYALHLVPISYNWQPDKKTV